MIRKIIRIDEENCDGCGLCIPNCAEGALQIIDGKARLISDLFCDGLGACIGYCPKDAITVEERLAEPYNELKVMENIIKGGENVIKAHLKHLYDHNEINYYNQAVKFLEDKKIPVFIELPSNDMKDTKSKIYNDELVKEQPECRLTNWPIQFHLINPTSSHFNNADVLLAADCAGYAAVNFRSKYLTGKSLIIACPKLDQGKDIYFQKLTKLLDEAEISSLTVMIMEVPCCSGLFQLAKQAASASARNIPINVVVIKTNGEMAFEGEA